jgi:2'-5' RNA ligase
MNRRVFAAIDISEEARREATAFILGLRTEFPDAPVRWERSEKLHITVRFAGSLDEEQLGIFTQCVRAAAEAAQPFRMKLSGTGAFAKRRGPSVLWLGVEQIAGSDVLGQVARMLDGKENRPFHPHVTIARIKDEKKAKELIERHRNERFESGEFEVNEIVIYESELRPTGSVYSKILSFALAATHV